MFQSNKSATNSKFSDSGPSELNSGSQELDNNIAIHVMPESFRKTGQRSDSHKKTGALILSLGFLLIMAIGAGGYYYYFVYSKNLEASREENPANTAATTTQETNVQTPAASEVATSTSNIALETAAKGRYLQFRKDLDLVTSMEDYDLAIKKYSSLNFQTAWNDAYTKSKTLQDEDRANFFKLVKSYFPLAPQLEKELTVKSSSQSSILFIMSDPIEIEIDMVYEQGDWKVNKETGIQYTDEKSEKINYEDWLKTKIAKEEPAAAATSTQIKLTPALDTDFDGLSDLEETLLLTNANAVDSDSDSYSDFKEFVGMYNPAGQGMLKDNASIKTYLNDTHKYSILYPADWSSEKIGGDDSVIFKSKDNQFIQIIVSPNPDREEIDDWFKRQFNEADINLNSVIEKRTADGSNVVWRGIKNKNGLVVYLAGTDKASIYTMTYNLGQSTKLDYINIFNMMMQSLEFSK